jgi:hypothetical protein
MAMPTRNGSHTRPLDPSVWLDQIALFAGLDATHKPRLYAFVETQLLCGYSYHLVSFSQVVHAESRSCPHSVVSVHGCIDGSISHEQIKTVLREYPPREEPLGLD